MADNILKAQPDADIRVVAVWQAIEGDGLGGSDPERILADPRVTQMRDPDLEIGRWFGDRDHTFHAGAGLAWDAFMLFDNDATFATSGEHLQTSGRTIIADHGKLRDALTSSADDDRAVGLALTDLPQISARSRPRPWGSVDW